MTDLLRVMADLEPEFHKKTVHLIDTAFPEFAFHGAVINKFWRYLYDLYSEFQFGLFDTESNEYLALGNSFPLFWDKPLDDLPDGGIEWALAKSVEQHEQGIKPNILCAFQIITSPKARGAGLSYAAVETMIEIARQNDLGQLIAPVRPNRKSDYPEMPMAAYVAWKRDDGMPHDDWLRAHARLGGKFIRICRRSFVVDDTIAKWREWTGMEFTNSGKYIVPGALVFVEIDLDAGRGLYIEPNVWTVHEVRREFSSMLE
jgi:hypothetical protein